MKRVNALLLCFMLTIILSACSQKSSNSNGVKIMEEPSDQEEDVTSTNETKGMHISTLQLTDDEERIWELFTSTDFSSIYTYATDDHIKSVTLRCYRLSNVGNFTWVEIGKIDTKAYDLTGLLVIRITDDIELINKNSGGMGTFTLTYSEYQPDSECASSVIWQSEADITYNDEIPLGMLITVIDHDVIVPRNILKDFNEPEKLEEYDSVIAFTACFSTLEKSEP